ncbi:glutamine amidotransferase-like class 1 domain-containing protein 1 isoform X1 [Phyllopteryx taeniolatus]|uniref:glutamine amidotransferase-like class 1 domain-containing protein 1 isoform X1 n=2 Tax=Phyllopteryx taeniolatus TaxID=161469 RepID=UPI002AD4255D|nr:glutamine amidotransferase-like class 1 domain-containing protein 1 isoform X1 [Phyllopteryx taeniolatus]XP_061630552.1 glutamine amidotransferase-like class 1 domain-containing protein 1 isoform X1 [Phyllopteryx taeniolatus]
MSAKPTCLIVLSASPQGALGNARNTIHFFLPVSCLSVVVIVSFVQWRKGVSVKSFQQCFSLCSSVFNLQTATPAGKPMDFVGVDDSTSRWVQDFNMKPYATPAKLESIDGARYQSLLIPDCPGAAGDLAHSGSLHRILSHFISQQKPVCAVGQGVSALCCATEANRWIFNGYSLTGPSVFELVRRTDFANLPLIVEDFVKDSGGSYTASQEDAVHVVADRHLITGQNTQSTWLAVNNLILLTSAK